MKVHDSDPTTSCWIAKKPETVLFADSGRDITCGLCALAAGRFLTKKEKP